MMPLVSGLCAIIPGGISVEDYAIATSTDHVSAKSMLLDLVENQIGVQEKQSFEFNDGDRLRAAILCLQRGAAVDDVASNLNWKDFEGLASEILDEAGFATIRNFIMKDPRREIDVIGIKMGVAMLIDCKHWKRTPVSALTDAAFKQKERTKQYVACTSGAVASPVIVTLHDDSIMFCDKVPIVPIHKFASFVEEFYGNLEKMDIIEKSS